MVMPVQRPLSCANRALNGTTQRGMSSTLDAFLRSWPFDPWFLLALLLTAAIYLRGHGYFRRRDPVRWHGGQVLAFLCGLTAIGLSFSCSGS